MLSRLFTITARVIAMALFAAIYEWWIFVVAGVHWTFMTIWLIWQKTEFHDASYDEIPFDAVIGIIHIFCFFNMKDGHTRHRALAFYTVIFIENTIMLALWYSKQESQEKLYAIPALGVVWGGFFVGILIMSLYYVSCHPTDEIEFCIAPPWTKHKKPTGKIESKDTSLHLEKREEISERKRYRYFFSQKWTHQDEPAEREAAVELLAVGQNQQ